MKPDFICIGAQKAGTTWLYDRLISNSEFSMPPIKEMHYFDRSEHYPTPNTLSETSVIKRIVTPGYTSQSAKRISKSLRRGDFRRALWWANYYFFNYSDRWYKSLYHSERGITGDITPSYSVLDESDVARMYKVTPDTKVIFLLRNPVDRAWSSYRHLRNFKTNENLKRFTERIGYELDFSDVEAIARFIESPFQQLRSDYIRTINTYLKHYPKSSIRLGFFDAIKEQPYQLLSELLRFIGANDLVRPKGLRKISNKSVAVPMPPEVRRMLEEKYAPMIEELASRYGSYATRWHQTLHGKNVELVDGSTHLPPMVRP